MSAPNLTKSLDHLFISKVRIKSLKYFVFNPDIPIHLRGLVRELKEEINAVRRELTRLDEIGFIRSEVRGNRKYFLLNRDYIFLPEIQSLFQKTFGLGGLLIKNMEHLGEVEYMALTGTLINFLPPNPNVIDLIVVGQIDITELSDLVHESEKKLNREINYTVMKSSEFLLKKKRRDAFIMQMMAANKIMLKGNVEEFAS